MSAQYAILYRGLLPAEMLTRLYTELSEVPLDASEWNQLVEANQTGSIFLQYHWIQTWWSNFGPGYKLRFITAEEDDRVIGFAPLMLDNRGCIRFIGDTNADYLDFVIPVQQERMLSGIFDLLYEYRSDWSSIELKNIPDSSSMLDLIPCVCNKSGLTFWNKYSIEAPSLVVKGNESDTRKLLSKYSIRRTEKHLRKYGEVEFRIIKDAAGAESLWTDYFIQHVNRCDFANRNSSFQNPKYRRFIIDLFNADTENRFTHFSALLVNGIAIAFHFGFISENRLLWYKPCFDISIKKGSPGMLLIKYLAEYVLDNGLDELDFTIGSETFKYRFCNTRRQVNTVCIYKSRVRFLYDYIHGLLRGTIKKIIRKPGLQFRLPPPKQEIGEFRS
ncbi:GNAT family N-acetyltransferase [Crocinitomicaceae bacterium]|nr:GNAT family N-acetyltransferase [Crocinitomicaceae bacterium]